MMIEKLLKWLTDKFETARIVVVSLALLFFAIGFALCTELEIRETKTVSLCVSTSWFQRVCIPGDPAGHIVVFGVPTPGTPAVKLAASGLATLYTLHGASKSDCPGSWEVDPANATLTKGYIAIDPNTMNPHYPSITPVASTMGGYGWGPVDGKDRCYVVGFKETNSAGGYYPEMYSNPFWEPASSTNFNVIACKVDNSWKWISSTAACP